MSPHPAPSRDLDSHYVEAGSHDRIRITIPKGYYVSPFEALSSTADTRYLAKGKSQELVRNLMRFSGIRQYNPASGQDGQPGRDPIKAGIDLGVTYVVSGSVRVEDDAIRVVAQMFDATTG